MVIQIFHYFYLPIGRGKLFVRNSLLLFSSSGDGTVQVGIQLNFLVKIKELKSVISKLPDETQVLMTAYENGYSEPIPCGVILVFTYKQGENSSIYGKYIKRGDHCFNDKGDYIRF